jgi:SNF2 family DNA or RNA helicase
MKALWQHQVDAIRKAEKVRDLALFFEQGTGKTRTTIEILRRRYHANGRLLKTLIICPPIVCENWKREFALYSKVNQKDIVVLRGPQTKRVENFLKHTDNLLADKIFVTNYESMQMDSLAELMYKWKPEILVCDESQRIKNFASKRAKRLAPFADITQHNYILTGTPILNSTMDIFMQFRILDRGETFGKNYFVFRSQYFMDSNEKWKDKPNHFPKYEMRMDMYDILQSKIKPKSLRVLKKDCLDLPPLIRQTIQVEMSKQQAKAYGEMKNDFIAFIESSTGKPQAVVAQLAITKALRMQQIVSGYASTETGEIVRFENPRLDALTELLEDITPEHKVIVWCTFKENYRMIAEVCAKLKIKFCSITGDNIKTRDAEMDTFRSNPEYRVMIANQAAGSVGINLVEASYMIYFSKSFKLEDDLQSEARNYRGGSEMHDKVTRIDLVATGTIDELINEALEKKQNIADKVLTWRNIL